jgi:hypothetical protein
MEPVVYIDYVYGTYIVDIFDEISVKHIRWLIDGVHQSLFDDQTSVTKTAIENLFDPALSSHEIIVYAYDPAGYKAILDPSKPITDLFPSDRHYPFGFGIFFVN